METIKKLLDQLVFYPKGITYNIEKYNHPYGIPDEETKDWFNVVVDVDAEKYHAYSDKYDEQYYNSLEYIEDSIHSALNYLQKTNDLRGVEYNHRNTGIIFNDLKSKLDKKMDEHLLKASRENKEVYMGEVEIFYDKIQPYPSILLTTNMPEEYSNALFIDITNTYDLDDTYINTNEYDDD